MATIGVDDFDLDAVDLDGAIEGDVVEEKEVELNLDDVDLDGIVEGDVVEEEVEVDLDTLDIDDFDAAQEEEEVLVE